MLVVIALGGNALARPGQPLSIEVQRANMRGAAATIAEVGRRHRIVVTHGNGPQVGLLALRDEAYREVAPFPLDVLDAEAQGMVGYLIAQELGRLLRPDRVVTLLTQVVVARDDPAFRRPTKPIGPSWRRRLVPSPEPVEIVELAAIRTLVASGFVVVCAGGGGIPVAPDGPRAMAGVEAVIDKDLSAALLARKLRADALLLLTDVDGVYLDHGTATARRVRIGGVPEMRALGLPEGSMGPKVEAACRFAEAGGFAAIGGLEDVAALLDGTGGTRVVPGARPIEVVTLGRGPGQPVA